MKFKRATYQNGSVIRESRKSGDVWTFRWRETNAYCKTVQRKMILGTIKELPTKAAASKAAAAIRLDINRELPKRQMAPMILEELVAHYVLKELQDDARLAQSSKAHSTVVAYHRYLRKWITPRWGLHRITEVAPIAVEEWLLSLDLAKGTKAKIRNLMSALFNHAMRHGFLSRHEHANPMHFVRQSAESDAIHVVLTAAEVWALIDELAEPVRTMALVDAFTGLRISELLALQWGDIDFLNGQIHVRRSIVYGRVGPCKTAASRKPVALDESIAAKLREHLARTPYNKNSDWVFASPMQDGKKPFTTGSLNRWHLRPAAKRAGIVGSVGWHTFRRTFATLLISNGETVKVVMESMRHANSKVTLDTYAQSTSIEKRTAQRRLIEQVLPACMHRPISTTEMVQ